MMRPYVSRASSHDGGGCVPIFRAPAGASPPDTSSIGIRAAAGGLQTVPQPPIAAVIAAAVLASRDAISASGCGSER
jgi:hypothetical protein